ncbi:prepilin-type N-terminal cleavage/methylation domain-containing protein [Patescibacteria group bacterium]|nr:prepilin-type N-terminal cleavage/methylation domain-containing protein [Patescibacteria group bacterium]
MRIYLTGAKTRVGLPGFSLMEMLIVTALFSILVLVMAQTFSSFNLLHRKIANRSVLNQDARFITEMVVRAARNNPLSYSSPYSARETELRLVAPTGLRIIFKQSDIGQAECDDLPAVRCLLLSTDGGASWTPVSGKNISVERFYVYVRPSVSPFELINGAYQNDVQPFVTLDLSLRYMASNPKEQDTLQVQTTVSSRVYLR